MCLIMNNWSRFFNRLRDASTERRKAKTPEPGLAEARKGDGADKNLLSAKTTTVRISPVVYFYVCLGFSLAH